MTHADNKLPDAAHFPRVRKILDRLGADPDRGRTPVVIAIPHKSKGPVTPGWNETSWAMMSDEGYLAILEASPNLGVILGGQSGPLATIDIDVEECVEPFLEANPRLRHGLRTKGKKGCQLWMWMLPDDELQIVGPEWQRGFPEKRFNIEHKSLVIAVDDGHGGERKRALVAME